MKVFLGRYPKKDDVERTVRVRIDDYDTWDAQSSMALIILPMLKKYKDVNTGYPASLTEESWNDHLDKMIWSFDQIAYENQDEPKHPREESEMVMSDEGIKCNPEPSKDQHEAWKKAMNVYYERIKEGTKLFGEWYSHLWW